MNFLAQFSLYELLSGLGSLIGFFLLVVWALGKSLLKQVKATLAEKFQTEAKARESESELRRVNDEALRNAIERYTKQSEATAKQVSALEREWLEWKAELPVIYVRREDYIRGQVVMEAKQDALIEATKVVQLQLEHIKGQQGKGAAT